MCKAKFLKQLSTLNILTNKSSGDLYKYSNKAEGNEFIEITVALPMGNGNASSVLQLSERRLARWLVMIQRASVREMEAK